MIPISLNGSSISPKWSGHNTKTLAHVQLDRRMNTWNGNSTISINVSWWQDIWIRQHAKFYTIFSKWFVNEIARLNRCYKTVEIKWSMSYPCLVIPIMSSSITFELKLISGLFACKCTKTWTCDEPTDGQPVWGQNGVGNKDSKKKESIFVMVWPWPLSHDHEKSISRGTITITVCTKFENDPSSAFWVIAWTICAEGSLNIKP